ncbi:hypothetical protein [Arenimonas oryziterrae]|nr:hypothetical protein [Arenimonas oryziterrae]
MSALMNRETLQIVLFLCFALVIGWLRRPTAYDHETAGTKTTGGPDTGSRARSDVAKKKLQPPQWCRDWMERG